MAAEVNPEVKAKEAEERQRKEEERKQFAKQLAVILRNLSPLKPSSYFMIHDIQTCAQRAKINSQLLSIQRQILSLDIILLIISFLHIH